MLKTMGIGRLASDVEKNVFTSGKVNAKFTMAFASSTRKDEATFVKCVAWGKRAEFVYNYFSKGKPATIFGRLSNNNYTDKNGVKRYELILIVDEISFVPQDKKNDIHAQNESYYSDEDIPPEMYDNMSFDSETEALFDEIATQMID